MFNRIEPIMARLGKVRVKPLKRQEMLEVVQRALLIFGLLIWLSLKPSCSLVFFKLSTLEEAVDQTSYFIFAHLKPVTKSSISFVSHFNQQTQAILA